MTGRPDEAGAAQAPADESTPPPPHALRWAPEPTTRLFGRVFPRATGAERLAWCALLLGVVMVLALAATLTPDPRGIGTHEQIPFFGGRMKPCGFAYATGLPCPSCGFTTTFAFAAHGHIFEAIRNQPFGFLVFLVTCLLVPASLGAAIGKVSWARVSDAWPWKRILLVTVVLWLAAWAYKIEMVRA